ncbi:MAG TPA: nitrite reductase, partial [Candidatus Eisenbacteria bacterium]
MRIDSKSWARTLTATRRRRWTLRALALGVVVIAVAWSNYSRLVNLVVPEPHRPGRVTFPVERLSDQDFERIAAALQSQARRYVSVDTAATNPRVYAAVARQLASDVRSFDGRAGFSHIDRFRKAGIRSYEGPQTCMGCHQNIRVRDGRGGYQTVSLRTNLESSVHFGLNKTTGFNTYGFDGRLVQGIPVGKIDRACGIPGSFTWTGWATLVKTANGDLRSDGCGQ